MSAQIIDQRLQQISKEAKQILEYFDTRDRVPLPKVDQVQLLLKNFKEHVKSEYNNMDSSKGQTKLTEEEQRFYWPAIQDAWANTQLSSIRWNSTLGPKWVSTLEDVVYYMDYWSPQKRDKL